MLGNENAVENILDSFNIERMERDILLKFGWMFKNSLDEFSTSIDRSLGYLDKIILPTIMASQNDRSYNPFSEIIEKYAIHILIHKFEKEGYKLLPLGYSADLTLENNDHIINIDVKTANLENLSDFKKTINVGINQMSHLAKIRISRKKRFLPDPFFVYPTIPPFYKFPDGKIKIVLTYGLLFIYPSYSDLIREIRGEYRKLSELFEKKVDTILTPKIAKILDIDETKARDILKKKNKSSLHTRKELIVRNIIRGIFIHEHERNKILEGLDVSGKDRMILDSFSRKLKEFTDKLRERDIKPIAIVAIAIPNGLLKYKYLDKFVSGKNWSESARYYYMDGVFEVIKEKTGQTFYRVIFLDINEKYIDDLKKYFGKIRILDFQIKEL